MSAQDSRVQNIGWSIATILFIAIASVALGFGASQFARLRGASTAGQRRTFNGYAFAAPWIVGFLIFVLGPSLVSLYYSFTNYTLGNPIQWIGLDNYRNLLVGPSQQSQQLLEAMFNSFYYALIGVPLTIGASLGMAMLLNREWPFIRMFRTVFYLPVILAGGPAVLLTWRYMMNGNGGFINIALQKFAQSFFVFGFLYRAFIYITESFNGFYFGLTRGDSVGPLAYALPAVIGFLILLLLVRGAWSEGKRVLAWRAAQLIGLVVLYALGLKGLVSTPVDPLWTLVAGILTTIFVMQSASQGQTARLRAIQIGGLVAFGIGFVFTLVQTRLNISGDTIAYSSALILGAIPLAISVIGKWNRRKYTILFGALAILSLILLVKLIPGQWDGGQLAMLPRYLTFQSTLDQNVLSTPSDPQILTYLKTGYGQSAPSSLWIYGAVAVIMLGIALLNKRPQARRIVLIGALVVVGLFAASALIDGVRYFHTFDLYTQATGKPSFHFALFRQSIVAFPDINRVPLWLTNQLWTKPSLILITMWSSGTGMLIFLAALKGVPKSLYEAAQVDGASKVQQFFRITLPMISPAMFYNLIIGIIAALQTFESIYIFTPGTNNIESLQSAAYYLFTRTFQQLNIGEGSAISWILAFIILTITAIQFRFSGWVYYEV
ncbi:MAG: carbohydrate ABC transporter permease [Aggregatilineales bacterium]